MTALFAFAAAAAAQTAADPAKDYPSRPIRIIAPSTPGGAADTFARLLADQLGPRLGTTLIVDNRAGGGGLIGMAAAAHAEPDGYTLVTSSIAYNAIEPIVSANPGFDPARDFTHVAFIGGQPDVFLVSTKSDLRSLKDVVELARRGAPPRLLLSWSGRSPRASRRHRPACPAFPRGRPPMPC